MHKPRKRFGQHFLCDQAMIQRIVDVIAPQVNERLVEIGPGEGAITFPVLERVGKLDAVELDRDLIPILKDKSSTVGELTIHESDALAFDFSTLKTDERPIRLFGNLPYNISSPLIFHLLDFANDILDMTFMLQKEMADRLAASVDGKDYGRLSVMVQYRCDAELLFDVSPECFNPPPKVDSSIIKLVPHPVLPYQANDEKQFARLVKQAFAQRRKTLRNNLKGLIDDAGFEEAGIDSRRRAETLTVEEFVGLSNIL